MTILTALCFTSSRHLSQSSRPSGWVDPEASSDSPVRASTQFATRGKSSGSFIVGHTRTATVLPVKMDWPSLLNATAQIAAGCRMGKPRGWLVAASQSRAVLSQHPVSTVLPSGLNATV